MTGQFEKPRVRAQAGSRLVVDDDALPIAELTECEVFRLHGMLSSVLGTTGLTGQALDVALSETFRVAVLHISKERIAMQRRTSSIHVVGQEVG